MEQQTTAQRLVPVKRAMGQPYRLRPYEELMAVLVTDELIAIQTTQLVYTETDREVRFTARKLVMRQFTKSGFRWIEQDRMEVPDETFTPYIECRYGRGYTPEQWAEQMEWEANTHRPGSSRNPMDNFEVAMYREDTTDAMYKHWTGHRKGLGYTTESD